MEKRTRQFILKLTGEEHEYLTRVAIEGGVSAGFLLRERIYRNGWKDDLDYLRKIQKKAISEMDRRHRESSGSKPQRQRLKARTKSLSDETAATVILALDR